MTRPTLTTLDATFTIHRFPPTEPVPPAVTSSPLYWIGRTDEELSVVCDAGLDLPGSRRDEGWSCLKVLGPIDFSVVGLLAEIASVLAAAEISIFALSTFDTDYVLVKTDRLQRAESALQNAGFGWTETR